MKRFSKMIVVLMLLLALVAEPFAAIAEAVEQTELAIVKQPQSVTVAEGASAKVSVEAVGDGLTYQWYSANKGATKFSAASIKTATYSVTMNEDRDGRRLYCVVKDQYGNSVKSNTVTISMLSATPLAITQQPSNAEANNGETVTVSVKATGDGLTYQWYSANKGSTKFSAASIKTASYSVTMNEDRDGRRLYCVVKDQYGNSVQSETVTITMKKTTPLAITQQPTNLEGYTGETVSTTVVATGDGLTYKWYIAKKDSTKFSVSSITTDTYFVEMNEDRDGRRVYCIITDQYGSTVQSDTITLTLLKKAEPTELKILKQPEDIVAPNGTIASTAVEVQGDGLTYQWYYRNKTASTFQKASITDAVYEITMTDARNGRQIYCVITDEYGNSVQTETVVIRYPVEVKITKQPEEIVARDGEEASAVVEAAGDGLTYQWYYLTEGEEEFVKSDVTEAIYKITMAAELKGTKIYCVVADEYGNTVQSETVVIRYPVELQLTKQPEDIVLEKGTIGSTSVVAVGEGLSYQWYYRNKTASTFQKASVTDAVYEITMTDARNGRQIYCVVTDAYGNTVKSETVIIRYPVVLKITKQPEDVTAAEGVKAIVTVEAEGSGLTYQWYFANRSATKFSKASITSPEYSIIMNDVRNGRRVYCVITDEYGNTVQSETVTLSYPAGPQITKQPEDIIVAKGKIASTSVEATGEGLTYQWYHRNASGSSFQKGSVVEATYQVTMTDSRNGRQIYCVITDTYGNTVQTETVVIRYPAELTITKQPEDIVCQTGVIASTSVEAEGEGELTYQWYYRNKSASTFQKASITGPVYEITMSSARNGRQIYCVVSDAFGSTAKSETVVIRYPAELVITQQPEDLYGFENDEVSTTVVATGEGELTYKWFYADAGDEEFKQGSIVTDTYNAKLTDSRNGRRIYCEITDSFGSTIQSDIVTLYMSEPLPEGMNYEVDENGTIVITSYTGTEADVVIPESILGKTVVGIGNEAFKGRTSLVSIEIPETVVSIGSSAFAGCTALEEVTIPSGVTVIEASAFEGCTKLASVTMSNNVTRIGKRAFYNCTSLASINCN